MKSNYKKLGMLVEAIDIKNTSQDINLLLCLSIDKCFINSIANVIGTDLTTYKIIKQNQFAVSLMQVSRDEKVPIACLKNYREAIMSPAYMIFQIKNIDEILPEYLDICFKRSEFDREASFIAVGGVRGSMPWEDFCRIEIPVPPIEQQKKIVQTYNTLTKRIELKKQINEKLVEIIQQIFHHYFGFINGETSTFEENCIPDDWNLLSLGDICSAITKGTTPTTIGRDFQQNGINFIKGEAINTDHSFDKSMMAFIDSETHDLLKRSQIKEKDILFTIAGTLGKFAFVTSRITPANTNQAVAIIRVNNAIIKPEILYSYFLCNWHEEFYKRNIQQAVQANLSLTTIQNLPIIIPEKNILDDYGSIVIPLIKIIHKNFDEIENLGNLKNNILSSLYEN